jgi:hypothetical protein
MNKNGYRRRCLQSKATVKKIEIFTTYPQRCGYVRKQNRNVENSGIFRKEKQAERKFQMCWRSYI